MQTLLSTDPLPARCGWTTVEHPTGLAKHEGPQGLSQPPGRQSTVGAWHGAHSDRSSSHPSRLWEAQLVPRFPAAALQLWCPQTWGCCIPRTARVGSPSPGSCLGWSPQHPPAFGGTPDLTDDRRTYPEVCGGQKPLGGGRKVHDVHKNQKLWLQLCFISIWKQQESGNTACACKITVKAKYVGLCLLSSLIMGGGFSHAPSSGSWRSGLGLSGTPWSLAPSPAPIP